MLADPGEIYILGPTASGKSAAAMSLARHMSIEIISVDSAQIYRKMDIGTAKASDAERADVPHHLIDIVGADQRYSAAQFANDASNLITQIRRRGATPVLVGGTMLYVKALIEGLHELPTADAQVRQSLETEAQKVGWAAMHEKLSRLDPITAARLQPNDAQRIQRALEVIETSGQTMASLLTGEKKNRRTGPRLCIALTPSNRAVLHDRIAQRFHAMLDAGFVDEVRALRASGELNADLPSMRCVGYRQIWQWLDTAQASDYEATIERAIAATRQLAKRQLTWLRSTPDCQPIDCLAENYQALVLQAVEDFLQPDTHSRR